MLTTQSSAWEGKKEGEYGEKASLVLFVVELVAGDAAGHAADHAADDRAGAAVAAARRSGADQRAARGARRGTDDRALVAVKGVAAGEQAGREQGERGETECQGFPRVFPLFEVGFLDSGLKTRDAGLWTPDR
jgi:hypothetical protein